MAKKTSEFASGGIPDFVPEGGDVPPQVNSPAFRDFVPAGDETKAPSPVRKSKPAKKRTTRKVAANKPAGKKPAAKKAPAKK